MGLLQTIKRNPNVRRIFGERELKIIEKQLMGVKLKPSEVIRLSRDIRKKFDVIKDLSQNSSEFELKKGADIKKMIKDAKEVILESKYRSKIKKIILFGSAAENKLTLNSDIDIAVKFDDISSRDATLFRIEISSRVNDRIDVQVFNTLPNKLKKEIKEKGRALYDKQDK